MITTADLKSHTKADLVKIAKRLGVTGSSNMLKDDLVKAVAKASRSQARKSKLATKSKVNGTKPKKQTSARRSSKVSNKSRISNGKSATESVKSSTARRTSSKSTRKSVGGYDSRRKAENGAVPKKLVSRKRKPKAKPSVKPTSPRVLKRIREMQLQRESTKDIASHTKLVKPPGASEPIWEREPQQDRVSLFVRDAFWMHASWDITRPAIERARAALAEQWHSAKPVLRLLRLDESEANSETIERDIEIHGGVRNWYIDWCGVPTSFRVMIGYLTASGRFHCLSESNIVRTPEAGTSDDVDEHWSDVGADGERIFALSGGYDSDRETSDLKQMLEDRLQRELGAPALAKLGAAAESPFNRRNHFHFDMDIELVVYGSTTPDGYLTLNGEPVALRNDGTFALRLPFPDRRQVLPAIACSRDGSQQRMIVIAVERNTKLMEPLEKESDPD